MSTAAGRMYDAFVASDPAAAIAVVEDARADGMERERLFDEVFVPAMGRLGGAWAAGDVDEMTFTQASVVAEQMTSFVIPKAAVADTGVTVIVGSVQGEMHAVGRNMVVAVLKEAGHRVMDLGVDVRPAEFVDTVEETGARIVVACAEMAATAQVVSRLTDLLRSSGHEGVVVLASGGPFAADVRLAKSVGANGVVTGAESALKLIERIAADLFGGGDA
jgi:trimethylamine corrinoid protein